MKENQKEKNFNQELRKKIISLFLLFVFKVFFVITFFNNTNLKILNKLFDYATGFVFFRTIVFDLGKIYFKNIYANSKNLFLSPLKVLSALIVTLFIIMCFIFNVIETKIYFNFIFWINISLLVVFLAVHFILIVNIDEEPKKTKKFSIKYIKFKFKTSLEKNRNFSLGFSTLITTTVITNSICFIYCFFIISCIGNYPSTKLKIYSFLFSGFFSIIKEFCDYLSEYAVVGNFDKNLINFLKKVIGLILK